MPRATAKVSKAGGSMKVPAKSRATAKSAAAVKSAATAKRVAAVKKATPAVRTPRKRVAAAKGNAALAANEDVSARIALAPVELTPAAIAAVEIEATEVAPVAVESVEPRKTAVARPAAKARSEPVRVQLPARLQINNLDGLYAELSKLMTDRKQHVVLDAGDISLVDSAGVQLLVAFFRSFQAAGGKVEWDNYSVQMYQMADELGISGQLGG